MERDFYVFINSKSGIFLISSSGCVEAKEMGAEHLQLFDFFLEYPNVLSFAIYNPMDRLLPSLEMHPASLTAGNRVTLNPGLKLYINRRLIDNSEVFVEEFRPKHRDNKFELSFSSSPADITVEEKISYFFSLLKKTKYHRSINYDLQVRFIKFLLENNVLVKINDEFEKSGYHTYENEFKTQFKDKKLLSRQVFFLDDLGNAIIKKNASYQYEIIYEENEKHSFRLTKLPERPK